MTVGECDVCGHRWARGYNCPKCTEAEAALGSAHAAVMEWVQAVATKAAEDAVLRHENEEKHDG